jgi:alpha-D-xyloside xylohydrolase
VEYATEKPADPIEIRIYPGADGTFTLYEDENDSYSYESGAYSTIQFDWNDKSSMLTVGERTGKYPGMLENRTFRVVLVRSGHGTGGELTENADNVISYSGKTQTIQLTRMN